MILGVILQPIGDTIQQLFYNIHGMDLSFHRDNTSLQETLYFVHASTNGNDDKMAR